MARQLTVHAEWEARVLGAPSRSGTANAYSHLIAERVWSENATNIASGAYVHVWFVVLTQEEATGETSETHVALTPTQQKVMRALRASAPASVIVHWLWDDSKNAMNAYMRREDVAATFLALDGYPEPTASWNSIVRWYFTHGESIPTVDRDVVAARLGWARAGYRATSTV